MRTVETRDTVASEDESDDSADDPPLASDGSSATLQHRLVAALRKVWHGKGGASATLQTLISRFLVIGVNVATGVLTARYLGPEGRGALSAMTIWPVFLGGVMTLGLPSALIYNFRRYPEERSRLLGASLVIEMGLGIIVSLAGALLLPYWMNQYPDDVVLAAQLFMLSAPFSILIPTVEAVLKARDEFVYANGLGFAIPVATLAGLLALIITDSMTPIRAAFAYAVAGTLVFLPLTHLWRQIKPTLQSLWHSGRRLLHYGVRSWGIDALSELASKVDRALVVSILAPEAMGIYVVALSAAEALRVIQRAIQAVLFPKAASRPLRDVLALTGRAVRFNVALTTLGGSILFILGPFLLRVVYGPGFAEGATVLRVLIGEVLLTNTTMVLAQAFMAIDRPGVVTVLQGLGVAISVPLLAILVPQYGLFGAGLALLASGLVRFASVLACFPLLLKRRVPRLLLTINDIRSLRSLLS